MKKHLITTVLLVTAASSQSQIVLFSDTFSSSTAAAAGYYRFGTTGTSLAADNPNSELDFDYTSGAAARSGFIKTFSDQSLAVGDSITLHFLLNSRTLASTENHAFRWAIGNLGNPSAVPSVPVTADLTSNTPFTSGTRLMYQFSASTSTTAGFGQYVTGSQSPVHNVSGTPTPIAGFSGPANIATSGSGAVTLTITRTGLNDYSFSQTAFTTVSTGTLTGLGTNIFNTIAFSFNNPGAYSASFDLIEVVYNPIPEPTTWALLAVSLLTIILLRHRFLSRAAVPLNPANQAF